MAKRTKKQIQAAVYALMGIDPVNPNAADMVYNHFTDGDMRKIATWEAIERIATRYELSGRSITRLYSVNAEIKDEQARQGDTQPAVYGSRWAAAAHQQARRLGVSSLIPVTVGGKVLGPIDQN